jgi:hypothetical protein
MNFVNDKVLQSPREDCIRNGANCIRKHLDPDHWAEGSSFYKQRIS